MQLALTTKRVMSRGEIEEESDEAEIGPEMSASPDKEERFMLSQQYKDDKKTQEHIQRLRDECYLGLGKLIIERK